MGPNVQLANYFTEAFVHIAVACLIAYTIFVSRESRDELSFHARLAFAGLGLDALARGFHQLWFGARWALNMAGNDATIWFFNNSYFLTPNYVLGWIGVTLTTTALFRGNFIQSIPVKVSCIAVLWLTVWHIGQAPT